MCHPIGCYGFSARPVHPPNHHPSCVLSALICALLIVRANFLGIPGNQHFDTGKHKLSYYRARAAPACVASVLDTLPRSHRMPVLARALNICAWVHACACSCPQHCFFWDLCICLYCALPCICFVDRSLSRSERGSERGPR